MRFPWPWPGRGEWGATVLSHECGHPDASANPVLFRRHLLLAKVASCFLILCPSVMLQTFGLDKNGGEGPVSARLGCILYVFMFDARDIEVADEAIMCCLDLVFHFFCLVSVVRLIGSKPRPSVLSCVILCLVFGALHKFRFCFVFVSR